jgi:hypothetical protein
MPTLPKVRRRNPVALSPLLRKGGAHEKSKSAIRAEHKQKLQTELIDWHEELDEDDLLTNNPSRNNAGKAIWQLNNPF